MAVNPSQVMRIAALARLAPDGVTIERLTRDLNAILDHVAALERVDVEGVDPGAHVPGDALPFRDPSLDPDPLAPGAPGSLAPAWREGFFVVPRLEGMDADPAPGREAAPDAEPPP